MTDLLASMRWQLWVVAPGFLTQSLGTTIVNTALPSMVKSLGGSPLYIHMIVVSYVLTAAVMLPASGWPTDRVGVRNIFFTAIMLLAAGSLFCAQTSTLDQLVMARALQGVGGTMMVPVGRLMIMKIVPYDQYMVAMTFVTLPGQADPLLDPALGRVLVEYASRHWIPLINIPVGIVGAAATPYLMSNHTPQTRRFDLSGFLLPAARVATLILTLDGQRGFGVSPHWLAGLVTIGLAALLLCLWRACDDAQALLSFSLFHNHIPSLSPGDGFARHVSSGMLSFMTLVFLQIGLGFSPFHAGLTMIPMVLGSTGMKRIVVQVISRFDYHRVLIASTLGLTAINPLLMFSALAGWYHALPLALFLRGMTDSSRFSSMNTLTLKDLSDNLTSNGNSLLSIVMQLSIDIGITIAGLLLRLYGQQHMSLDAASTHQVFLYTYLSMVAIIAPPALIFSRVPDGVGTNTVIRRRNRSGS